MHVHRRTLTALALVALLLFAACGGGGPVPRPLPEEPPGDPIDDEGASKPKVAMNGWGGGIVAWNEGDQLRARWYQKGQGWQSPEPVNEPGYGNYGFEVAMLGNRAIVIWAEAARVRSRLFMQGDGWDPDILLHEATAFEYRPHDPLIACNPFGYSGRWFAVWPRLNILTGVEEELRGTTYLANHEPWQTPSRVDTDNVGAGFSTEPIENLRVVAGGNGTGMVSWTRSDKDLCVARYDDAWLPASSLKSTTSRGGLGMAPDGTGNAVLLYMDPSATPTNVYATEYHAPSDMWFTEDLIATGDGFRPFVALDHVGDGFAVWGRYGASTGDWRVEACPRGGPTFGAIQAIDVRDGVPAAGSDLRHTPCVGVDGAGNARALWQAGSTIYTAAYSESTGWGYAESLGTGRDPDLAMDDSGRAIAAWWNGQLVTQVWEPPITPVNLNLIVFASDAAGDLDVWIAETNGTALTTGPTQVTSSPADDWEPTLSPDGTQVCFVRDYEIWLTDATAGTPVQLTDSLTMKESPTFTPDGGSIVYVDAGNLMRYDLAAATTETLTTSGRDGSPSVSPDGTTLLYRSTQDLYGGFPSPGNLWTVPMDGSSDPVPVTTQVAIGEEVNSYGDPAWSPDASMIVCMRYNGVDTNDILVMDADGTNMVVLTNVDGEENRTPVYSPTGARIYYTCRYYSVGQSKHLHELRSLPAAGGALHTVMEVGDQVLHPSVPGKP